MIKTKAKPPVAGVRSGQPAEKRFIERLAKDYRQFQFVAGEEDHWSAKSDTITYNSERPGPLMRYSVLHELAHALLGHTTYKSDFELLKLEAEAWELATKIGHKYHVEVDNEHIQNCLDTYRDWLYQRSTCPQCGTHVLQSKPHRYHCYNCKASWKVTTSSFARPYRRQAKI